MDIRVFNRQLEQIDIIDNFISLKWLQKYYSYGNFTIKVPLTNNAVSVLKNENIVYVDGMSGFIESVQFEMSEDGEIITVNGKELSAYLARRINNQTINFAGTIENFYRKVVNDNCITTTSNRIIPNLLLGVSNGFTEQIKKQDSYSNLCAMFDDIALETNISYRIDLDCKQKKLIFNTYKGANRSVNQTAIAPLIFSRDFENVLEQTYIYSTNTFANSALILGEGEGSNRASTLIDNGVGLDKYEVYVDARDIQSTVDNVTISEAEYKELLRQRGQEKLAECIIVNTFDSVINTVNTGGYSLGDIVTLVDKKWGITLDARITEIEKIYENTGKTVNVVFGNNALTVTEKLRKGLI